MRTGFEVPMIRFGCGVFQDYVGELQALRSEAQVRAGVSISSARSRITAAPSCYTNKGALWLTWLSTWFLELCSVQPCIWTWCPWQEWLSNIWIIPIRNLHLQILLSKSTSRMCLLAPGLLGVVSFFLNTGDMNGIQDRWLVGKVVQASLWKMRDQDLGNPAV